MSTFDPYERKYPGTCDIDLSGDSQMVTITRAQLRRVLRDMALTVTGDGRGDDVFDALRAGDGLT